MLRVSGIQKYFEGQKIFSDFDLELDPGRFKVLVGPSGCGKSTLFNALTGVIDPDGGTISWKGRILPHLGNHAAYMQQKDLLLPWFSLLDNALLPVTSSGRSRRETGDARDRALHLFNRLGLKGYESYRPGQVSGGMRQRCALIRTLMFDRELILLDEPLSALDAVIGEWAGAQKGLGYLMIQSNARIKVDLVFASILWLSAMGMVMWWLVGKLEKKIFTGNHKGEPHGHHSGRHLEGHRNHQGQSAPGS